MDDIENLLQATIKKLAYHHKVPNDVLWVGSRSGGVAVTWDAYARMADRDYDAGYGGSEVFDDLVVVGIGWWLERYEYDGNECWVFRAPPRRTLSAAPFLSPFKRDYPCDLDYLANTVIPTPDPVSPSPAAPSQE